MEPIQEGAFLGQRYISKISGQKMCLCRWEVVAVKTGFLGAIWIIVGKPQMHVPSPVDSLSRDFNFDNLRSAWVLGFLTHLIHRDSRSSRFSRRKSKGWKLKVWKLKYAMAALHSSRTLARLLSLQVWSVPKGNIRLLLSWETLDYSHTHTFKVHNSHMKVLNIKHFHRHAQRLTVAYFQSLELLNVKR